MQPVTVEFELTPEDWEAANASHLFSSPLQKEMIRRARVSSTTMFGAAAALYLVWGSFLTAALWMIAGLTFSACIEPLQRAGQRRALKKLGQAGVSNGTFGHHRVEVREDGLLNATDSYEWLIRWKAIEGVREEGGTFLIYTGPNCFLPVPVTAFRDGRSLRDFADAFYHHLALHGGTAGEAGESLLPAPAG